MTKRSVLWLIAGVLLWVGTFYVCWLWQDASAMTIVGTIGGGVAGIMVGRALVFPDLCDQALDMAAVEAGRRGGRGG